MAGHSKWSNIKRKKGKEDIRRGKVFTKLSRYITVAAKEGGSDPEFNPALKTAIEKAKAENMPNDNIERAIKKASGSGEGDSFEDIMYEGYGPGGIAVLVSCLTDNRNRTASDVRHAFDKFGGKLGQTGCVSFMFERKGLLGIEKKDSIDEDTLMMEAIELGVEDIISDENGFEIITNVEDFNNIRDELSLKEYNFAIAEISYIPQNTSDLNDDKAAESMIKLIDLLEDNDDVQEIYHNWEIPDDLEL